MDPIDALLRYPLFALLGRRFLQLWAEDGRIADVQLGQELLVEGASCRDIIVLLNGRVRLTRATEEGGERSLGVLGAGAVVGEYALLRPHRNTATCRACEPGEVFLLPLALLQRALRSEPTLNAQLKNWLRLHALVHHFRHAAGLGFLTGPSLVPLLERCRELTFGVAHTLQAEGLLDNGWLFIQTGEVALHSEADQGQPRLLGPGDCLGERCLMGWSRLPLAVALTRTTCWYLATELFQLPVDSPVSAAEQTLQVPQRERGWAWLPQRGPADCGVAALAMSLAALGVPAPFEQLADWTPLQAQGASLASLAATARRLGVKGLAVRIGLEQLPHVQPPAVAHYVDGHYVTLFEVLHNSVVVGDPAEGLRELSFTAFRQLWSGNLLLLSHRKQTTPETGR